MFIKLWEIIERLGVREKKAEKLRLYFVEDVMNEDTDCNTVFILAHNQSEAKSNAQEEIYGEYIDLRCHLSSKKTFSGKDANVYKDYENILKNEYEGVTFFKFYCPFCSQGYEQVVKYDKFRDAMYCCDCGHVIKNSDIEGCL